MKKFELYKNYIDSRMKGIKYNNLDVIKLLLKTMEKKEHSF
ncbi:hypothetical protein [Maledivibacter halophilus]|uniref:Uncharacterized protein n=1 Tax=Maledivibacter halophilus TaxID=36842 RepID=A0A1T5L7V1_9FIRM|nr:hypothetical protein [Maledivibacter halophilus]SKC72014.1 hypothetical protein SAMN02194393_02549 [Maledivibacter halophilus]